MNWEFRGLHIEKKIWVYGSLVVLNGHYYILRPSDAVIDAIWQFEVDSSSVGIWTGEEATNGKIFLGDKVRIARSHQEYVVIYEKGCFKIKDFGNNITLRLETAQGIRIIGNIHEVEVSE